MPYGTTIQEVVPIKVKYCLYARKSTESEERQILSIDSQIKEMLQLADRECLEVVEMKRESHSAKETGQRPVFNEIVEEIREGKYNGILTWAPDRISRNAGDLGRIVDLMDAGKLQEIRTFGQKFGNNPNEKFLLMILGSQAKLENDNRGINVKRGLRTRAEMGLWSGQAPLGYLTQGLMDKKCQLIVDPLRAKAVKQIFEKVAYEQWSGRKVYNWLRFELNFYTRGNKPLTLGGVYRILENPFYYGVFERPRKSGNWYQGKHTPLITQELFEKAKVQLKRDQIVRETKEFAFTKLMTCGLCGSGISADEKYKHLKNGTVRAHVYYGCTRAKDKHCKCGYMPEDELIKQLQKLVDQIDLNETGIKKKVEAEVVRYKKFHKSLLGESAEIAVTDIDMKDYVKFLLKDGELEEKREIIGCFVSKVQLKYKQISLH